MEIGKKTRHLSRIFKSPWAIVLSLVIIAAVSAVVVGSYQKQVIVLDDGRKTEIVTFKGTVRDVLSESKVELNEKDKVIPALESAVTDEMTISIRRAVPVHITADNRIIEFLSAEQTVEDVLSSENIMLGNVDKVYPDMDTAVSKDMYIRVVRVTEKEITDTQKIPHTKEVKNMAEWEKGREKVVQKGSDGQKLITTKITYEDGVESGREVIGEDILKPAVNKVVAIGTLDWKTVSRGNVIRFKKMISMKATKYTDNIANTGKSGGRTATGTVPRRNSVGGKWSTVAVDPRVIPLGTRLWIEDYGFAIAEDTGGAVKGNIIDLFFTDGSEEYRKWGTRTIRVYILK